MCKHLLLGDLDLAVVDVVRDGLGAAAIDLAAGGESSSEDLKNGTLQVLGHGLEAHSAGEIESMSYPVIRKDLIANKAQFLRSKRLHQEALMITMER